MSTVYEGFITEDTTPQAFALTATWNAKMEAFKSLPEQDLQGFVGLLQEQQRELIRAIGRIEHAVNFNAGKVITADGS